VRAWQDAERAYQLYKARQVADQQGSGVVAVPRGQEGEEGEAKEALVDFALHELKGNLFPDLMDYMWDGGCPQGKVMWGGGCPQGGVFPLDELRGGCMRWAWLVAADFARRVTRCFRKSGE
jgi:hypothetical protein